MESYTTSKHSTNTSIACDTSSIKVDITDTSGTMVYAITLCKFLEFTQFWSDTNDNITRSNTSTMLLQPAY